MLFYFRLVCLSWWRRAPADRSSKSVHQSYRQLSVVSFFSALNLEKKKKEWMCFRNKLPTSVCVKFDTVCEPWSGLNHSNISGSSNSIFVEQKVWETWQEWRPTRGVSYAWYVRVDDSSPLYCKHAEVRLIAGRKKITGGGEGGM